MVGRRARITKRHGRDPDDDGQTADIDAQSAFNDAQGRRQPGKPTSIWR
jgi:hypothetical protein